MDTKIKIVRGLAAWTLILIGAYIMFGSFAVLMLGPRLLSVAAVIDTVGTFGLLLLMAGSALK